MAEIGGQRLDASESAEIPGVFAETGGSASEATREAAIREAQQRGGFPEAPAPEWTGDGPETEGRNMKEKTDVPDEDRVGFAETPEVSSQEKGAARNEVSEDTGRFENAAYRQGENDYGYRGTCGPTSSANAINLVTGRHDCSENQAVHTAVERDLCDQSDDPGEAGATSTQEVAELVDSLSQPGDHIHTEVYQDEKALMPKELADRVSEEGTVAIVGVDSAALWDESGEATGSGLFQTESPSDHWITVESPSYDSQGSLDGFHIVDSGGGKSFVDIEKFERSYLGDKGHQVSDPTVIIVSDHEETQEPS